MNTRRKLAALGVTALVAPAGALVVGAGTAGAATAVTSVTFSGSQAAPTVTVHGYGFGKAPTTGVSVSTLTNCGGIGTGDDYSNGALWIDDPSEPFSAGARSGTQGDCMGLNIVSWTSKQVVFTFGSQYGPEGQLVDGNGIVVSVKGLPGDGIVPINFP